MHPVGAVQRGAHGLDRAGGEEECQKSAHSQKIDAAGALDGLDFGRQTLGDRARKDIEKLRDGLRRKFPAAEHARQRAKKNTEWKDRDHERKGYSASQREA